MTPLFRKFLGMNWVMVFTMIGILVFGVFAIYSASWMRDSEYLQGSWERQTIWIVIGLVVFFATSLIDYKWVKWGAIPLYAVGLLLLIAVKIPGIGVEKSGARSWIEVGTFSMQPSQAAIVAGIMILALTMSDIHRIHPILRHPALRLIVIGVLGGIPFLLILKEPDIGSAAVWGPLMLTMMLVGNIPFRYMITLVLLVTMVIPVVYFFMLKPYQKERIDVWIDMLMDNPVDIRGPAWVPHNARIAVGSAGWKGKGFRAEDSVNQMGFIPEDVAINDFVFAVLAEEHGFRGAMILIAAQALLLLQCLFVSFFARDQIGRLLCVGIVAQMFTHIFMNVGMNIMLVPITGLPLPFTSYGGTFALSCMFLMGLVQSVWVHRNEGMEPTGSKF